MLPKIRYITYRGEFNMIRLIIFVLALLTINIAYAQSGFVAIALPQNVTIKLPKNWVVASDNTKTTLEAYSESMNGHDNTDLKFLAECYDQQNKRVASINIIYLPKSPTLTQLELRSLSLVDISSIDNNSKNQIYKVQAQTGIKIFNWEKSKRVEINGVTLLQFGYSRLLPNSGEGVFIVRTFHMFAGPKSFILTISYSKDSELVFAPITNYIINSLKQT